MAAAAAGWAGCAATSDAPYYPENPRHTAGTVVIDVVGDTQGPLGIETMRFREDDNEDATFRIFRAMARDSDCAAVIHLGDLTALGGYAPAWERFDEEAEPLRAAGIPLYPAIGNHDIMPFEEPGRANMAVRFPCVSRGWYARRIGPAGVIILNSNFIELSEDERASQREWYRRTLAELEEDSAVAAVLVACHHPPYTNSAVAPPNEDVERSFVAPFLASSKTRLFLSGHVHAFEHIRSGGKDFIVSGGGGGLAHPLRRGTDARWTDLYRHETDTSMFHYLRLMILPGSGRVAVEVRRLAADRRGFETAYRAEIP